MCALSIHLSGFTPAHAVSRVFSLKLLARAVSGVAAFSADVLGEWELAHSLYLRAVAWVSAIGRCCVVLCCGVTWCLLCGVF